MSGILIVDDDSNIRTLFTRALTSLADVEQAANGGEALRMLGAKKYDLMLLDLHMPVIDGFVVLHTLASKPGPNKDTPIFVVTVDTSEQARLRALRQHTVYFLPKPVSIATLTVLVETALKKGTVHVPPAPLSLRSLAPPPSSSWTPPPSSAMAPPSSLGFPPPSNLPASRSSARVSVPPPPPSSLTSAPSSSLRSPPSRSWAPLSPGSVKKPGT